jgi:bifunctional UDP-N-acetylglucosamine pyrophosphorylase/glucosamine-1-phosphate N-acetyltransferase
MAVARGRQRNVEGWVERARAGSPAAEAARAAGGPTAKVSETDSAPSEGEQA